MLGILSSGPGGLLFARELNKLMPDVGFVYWGDTAHGPYGSRSAERVGKWVGKGLKFLEEKGVEAIVVASGDASIASRSADVRRLTTQMYADVKAPIVDYWDMQIKAALAVSKKKRIGIMGSRLVIERTGLLGLEQQGCVVLKKAIPALAPLILEGEERRGEMRRLIRAHLQWFKTQNIDILILGSILYVRMYDEIQAKMGKRMKVIHPVDALMGSLTNMGFVLHEGKGAPHFYFTDITPRDLDIASQWFGRRVCGEKA
ncbi:MAG: hypothetical protein AB1352_01290 [Patescibacteria group bacterium]